MAGHHVAQRWDDLDAHPQRLGGIERATDGTRFAGWDRHEQLGGAGPFDRVLEVVEPAVHAMAEEP